ncbi:hypothetical protein IFR05_015372 [Cadophora sp. M221]|nr:hypothetical protein IFR05_015372 [Cadophora sp. M221]
MALSTSARLIRYLPFLGYHHVIMIFLVFGTILLSIVVAGCTTSNNLQNVYVLSLSYVSNPKTPTASSPVQLNPDVTTTFATIAATHSALEVRVGYLGICISQVHSQWMCSNNALTLSNLIKLYGGVESGEQDPLNLIWIAGRFKDEMLYSGLLLTSIALAFVATILLSTFPSWYDSEDDAPEEEEGDSRAVPKPYPSRPVMKIVLGSLVISVLFCFISVLLQHVASAAGSAMVEALSYGTVNGKVGPAVMVLGWAGELLYVISAAGVLLLKMEGIEAGKASSSASLGVAPPAQAPSIHDQTQDPAGPPMRIPAPQETSSIGTKSDESDEITDSFKEKISSAAEFLDHLRDGRLRESVLYNAGRIVIADYVLSENKSTNEDPYEYKENIITFSADPESMLILENISNNIEQRLIVVEDIYPWIMALLVTRFGVSPEFFEVLTRPAQEHLINSGYGGLRPDEKEAYAWKTAGIKKSHISMKWYRPTWRLPKDPFSRQDLEDLLNPEVGSLEYTRGKSKGSTIELASNIFRIEWELWTNPDTTIREKRRCGFEERASIWKGKMPNSDCDLVILLLDPLPVLRESTVRFEVQPRSSAISFSGSSEETSTTGDDTDPVPSSDMESGLSGNSRRSRSVHSAVLNSKRRLEPKRRSRFVPQWLLGLLRRGGDQRRHPKKVVSQVKLRPVIEQIGSRVPSDISLEEALKSPPLLAKLRSQLSETSSTFDTFDVYLDDGEHAERKAHFDLVSPLFEIVQRDYMEFLKMLHTLLDEINEEMLDDTKMEDRLTRWRQILTRAHLELPEMKRSMIEFFNFLPLASQSPEKAIQINTIHNDPDLQKCLDGIDKMIQRLQAVTISLTSNMALLDSRRSIAEAQSITRLTELAFLFIPLTFAATLFGMQIDQFANPVPLSTFVIIAITLSGFSYGVRLAIRSSWLRSIKHSSKEGIKKYADWKRKPIQGGYVSTTLFLEWLFHLLYYLMMYSLAGTVRGIKTTATFTYKFMWFFLSPLGIILKPLSYITLICILPLSILWTRQLNQGIQIAVTIACISSISVVVVAVFWKSGDHRTRSGLPRLLRAEYELFKTERHSTFFSLLLWSGGACVFLIPIAVLWSSDTAPGVKAALMTVLVLALLVAWFTYGVFKLIQLARGGDSDSESDSELDDDGSIMND